MKDNRLEILYIGKAKVLRNRVRSYFQNSRSLHPRTRIFLSKVDDIKFLTTKTEAEALILESNFIKKHQLKILYLVVQWLFAKNIFLEIFQVITFKI